MASDKDSKLTKYTSAVTIITSDVMNKLYGGEYGYNDSVDEFHPLVFGHVHDGTHQDGHASKILLTNGSHVRGYLANANLGGTDGSTPAVRYSNIMCYSDATYGSPAARRAAAAAGGQDLEILAIPEFTEDALTGEKCYYLDLSNSANGVDGSIQFNKDGGFFGNNDLYYNYDLLRLGVGTDTPEAKLHIVSGLDNAVKIDGLTAGSGTPIAIDGLGNLVIDATIGSGDVVGPLSSTQYAVAQFADTSGDLLTETPLGLDGQYLIVDSGATNGLSWAVPSLDDLVDVNAPAPSDGQVLAWNIGLGAWVPSSPAEYVDGPATSTQYAIAQFADTSGDLLTETPLGSDGEVLIVDSLASAGLSWTTLALPNLSDVSSGLSPGLGHYLSYNNGTGEWESSTIEINDLTDVLAAPTDEAVLTYDSGVSKWISKSSGFFFSQWCSDIEWIANTGLSGNRFPVALSYVGASGKAIVCRALFDDDATFHLTTPLPMNGRVSAGDINNNIVGAHQNTFSLIPDEYIDDISNPTADSPSSCRITLYFILHGGNSAGIISNMKIKLYYGSSTDPATLTGGKIFEYEDGRYIHDEYWNDRNESDSIVLEADHSYSAPINNGRLVVSDFSPLKLNSARVASGLDTFKVEVVPDPATDTYFGVGETFSPNKIGLLGSRLLWTWE